MRPKPLPGNPPPGLHQGRDVRPVVAAWQPGKRDRFLPGQSGPERNGKHDANCRRCGGVTPNLRDSAGGGLRVCRLANPCYVVQWHENAGLGKTPCFIFLWKTALSPASHQRPWNVWPLGSTRFFARVQGSGVLRSVKVSTRTGRPRMRCFASTAASCASA